MHGHAGCKFVLAAMQDNFETIDAQMLAAVSGASKMTNAAMSGLVKSRLNSSFGDQGSVQLVGNAKFGPDKKGTVMGRGKFAINSDRAVEMRSWTAVLDVGHSKVEHLQTKHLWVSD